MSDGSAPKHPGDPGLMLLASPLHPVLSLTVFFGSLHFGKDQQYFVPSDHPWYQQFKNNLGSPVVLDGIAWVVEQFGESPFQPFLFDAEDARDALCNFDMSQIKASYLSVSARGFSGPSPKGVPPFKNT